MRLFLLLVSVGLVSLVRISTGPVNSVSLPEGAAIYGAPGARTVLVTHVRRDVLWAAGEVPLVAPEREVVRDVGKFWSLFRQTRFHDYAQKSTKLAEKDYVIARTVR